jgi:hypothetical protein
MGVECGDLAAAIRRSRSDRMGRVLGWIALTSLLLFTRDCRRVLPGFALFRLIDVSMPWSLWRIANAAPHEGRRAALVVQSVDSAYRVRCANAPP